MNKNTGKLVIVVICLAVAGILIASQMGLFGGGGGSSATTTATDSATPTETPALEGSDGTPKKAEFPKSRR